MPEISITLTVKAAFREKSHRESIVETVLQGAGQVLTNILMLTPTNNRIAPRVTMIVREQGEEDFEINIVDTYAEIEDS